MKTNPLRNTKKKTCSFCQRMKSESHLRTWITWALADCIFHLESSHCNLLLKNWLTNCALRAALQRRRRYLVAVPEKLVLFSFGTVVCFIMFYPHVEWWLGKFGITIKWHPISFQRPWWNFVGNLTRNLKTVGIHICKQALRELMSYRCWEFGLKINNS